MTRNCKIRRKNFVKIVGLVQLSTILSGMNGTMENAVCCQPIHWFRFMRDHSSKKFSTHWSQYHNNAYLNEANRRLDGSKFKIFLFVSRQFLTNRRATLRGRLAECATEYHKQPLSSFIDYNLNLFTRSDLFIQASQAIIFSRYAH